MAHQDATYGSPLGSRQTAAPVYSRYSTKELPRLFGSTRYIVKGGRAGLGQNCVSRWGHVYDGNNCGLWQCECQTCGVIAMPMAIPLIIGGISAAIGGASLAGVGQPSPGDATQAALKQQ